MIVLASLPGQALFGVATMTLSAAVTLYAVGLGYFALTGTYWFVERLHPGRGVPRDAPADHGSVDVAAERGGDAWRSGALYALSVFALYALLGAAGAPAFYDKLLAVPILNLAVRGIDRMARPLRIARGPARPGDPAALAPRLGGPRRHAAWAGVWVAVFLGMSSVQAVGDTHRGQWVTFWLAACAGDRPHGCRHAARLTAAYCDAGSGWACNEYGVLVQPARRPALAAELFARACDLGFTPGCANLDPAAAATPERGPPADADLRIVLRARAERLANLSPVELREAACGAGIRRAVRAVTGRRPELELEPRDLTSLGNAGPGRDRGAGWSWSLSQTHGASGIVTASRQGSRHWTGLRTPAIMRSDRVGRTIRPEVENLKLRS